MKNLPRRRLFALGFVLGALAVVGARQLINHTSLADQLVAPLWMEDTQGRADMIIVLGAGIIGDCTPNTNAVRRVMLAARLWREQRAPAMLFTGGEPAGLPCAAATVMADLAHELGVPRAAMRLETASHSTQENAALSAPLLRQERVRRVLVVTDRLHMPRASGVFTHLGFDVERASVPVFAGHSDNVSMLGAGLREYVALLYYWWRGWLGSGQNPAAAPIELSHAARSARANALFRLRRAIS